jgi:hypothetical protein
MRNLLAEIIQLRMPTTTGGDAGGCAATRFPLKPGHETEEADPRRNIG